MAQVAEASSSQIGEIIPSRRARHYKNKSPQPNEDAAALWLRRSQPEYIQCCAHNPKPPKVYSFWAWKVGAPNDRTRVPYHCNSWRCDHCQPFAASVIFARMRSAFQPFKSTDCVFVVLTLDPDEHLRGVYDLAGVYREFGRRKELLFKRWERWLGKLGLGWCGNQWVATVEAHRTGVPHLNIVMHAPDLAHYLRPNIEARKDHGLRDHEAVRLFGAMLTHAQSCGFGWASTAEPVGSNDAAIGYITKLAKDTDRTHAEIAKLTQLPLQAPKNFRRVRAGSGFLPPVKKNPEYTGTVVRRFYTDEGDMYAEPLVLPKDPARAAEVAAVVAREQEIWYDEENKLSNLDKLAKTARLLGLPPPKAGPAVVSVHQFAPNNEGNRDVKKESSTAPAVGRRNTEADLFTDEPMAAG